MESYYKNIYKIRETFILQNSTRVQKRKKQIETHMDSEKSINSFKSKK